MRCWLLSLGFIGDEYKTARKILISKLEGSSSYKAGTALPGKATCKQPANRQPKGGETP